MMRQFPCGAEFLTDDLTPAIVIQILPGADADDVDRLTQSTRTASVIQQWTRLRPIPTANLKVECFGADEKAIAEVEAATHLSVRGRVAKSVDFATGAACLSAAPSGRRGFRRGGGSGSPRKRPTDRDAHACSTSRAG